MSTQRGKLIVIEGIDGSGKTTQEELIVADMLASKSECVVTKQPTEWYRSLPIVRSFLDSGKVSCSHDTLGLLAAADRMLHIESLIEPSLALGKHVICNRYVYSTYAYFEARGANADFIEAINSRVPKPDCGILLRIDSSVTVKRIAERDGNSMKYEERDAAYLAVVQASLERHWPSDFLVCDGLMPVAAIYAEIKAYLVQRGLFQDPTNESVH